MWAAVLVKSLVHMWLISARILPWLLLLVALLIVLRLPRRFKALKRRRLLKQLEEKGNTKVIAMIHRGGPFRLFAGNGAAIGLYEAETILKIIRETPPDKNIDLILHTPGGLVLSTAQIARALKNHPGRVRALIPHWAMSGGTFLALAADEIIMDKNAVLGPVDPQTMKFPGMVAMASVLRVTREKSKDEIEDATWILADQAEKAIKQIEDHITWLLTDRLGPEKARELGRTFTEGRWTHDYPITCDALRDMGLHVSTDVPAEVYELLEAYPSGSKFRPVQWLPGKKPEKAGEDQKAPPA